MGPSVRGNKCGKPTQLPDDPTPKLVILRSAFARKDPSRQSVPSGGILRMTFKTRSITSPANSSTAPRHHCEPSYWRR